MPSREADRKLDIVAGRAHRDRQVLSRRRPGDANLERLLDDHQSGNQVRPVFASMNLPDRSGGAVCLAAGTCAAVAAGLPPVA
jgi:hypothetical protein